MDHSERNLKQAQETVIQVRQALLRPKRSTPTHALPVRAMHIHPACRLRLRIASGVRAIEDAKAAGEDSRHRQSLLSSARRRAADTSSIDGRTLTNFSSYDYLGLNGHPDVVAAAKAAIDEFGTSVSASRLTAGERRVHRDLEERLARLHRAEDAVSFVSGHATNVSVIGGLLGPDDMVVTDALVHNSVVEGAKLSGAKRILCPHGDLEAFERALRLNRARQRRALIVVEGLYSMDGDVPDLASLVRLKQRYEAWLMVDEAHSIGVLGATGRGIAEEQNVDPDSVDIWMGTLSKALTATGGYIAGSQLIELLKLRRPALSIA